MNPDLGPLPTISPRHEPTTRAARKLDEALDSIREEFSLSCAEYLTLLTDALTEHLHALRRIEWRRLRERGDTP